MYKSKKGWYYKKGTARQGVGPFDTPEEAKKAAKERMRHSANFFCTKDFHITVYYGTPCRLSAAKDVYIKDRGHVYFTRVR